MSKRDDDEAPVVGTDPGSYWRVWTCIDKLLREEDANAKPNRMMADPYRSTTLQVASILRIWGRQWAGDNSWASVLNKSTLHHEAEECIVALYHLRQWMTSLKIDRKDDPDASTAGNSFIAVDVCGGKGIFSMMLSYMASEFWLPQDVHVSVNHARTLKKIVLLEKATDIDWHHVNEANNRSPSNNTLPKIELWSDTNLHKYDNLIQRLEDLSADNDNLPLALTGIHLCKMLSPSFVNIVNGLGPQCCPYLCLAPCCLPRVVINPSSKKHKGNNNQPSKSTTIPIYLHETKEARESRLDHNRRKHAARNRFSCYLCHSSKHWVKRCPQYTSMEQEERQTVMAAALVSVPCWLCGVVGHFRNDCPTPEAARITTRNPTTVEMDVSDIIASDTPYETYCRLLANHIDLGDIQKKVELGSIDCNTDQDHQVEPVSKKVKQSTLQVIEAGLTDTSAHEKNWNSRRKSIFIIVTR